jgi:hypothetical protein
MHLEYTFHDGSLVYVFPKGVEYVGQEGFTVFGWELRNDVEKQVAAGTVRMKSYAHDGWGMYLAALLGVLYAMAEDRKRHQHPHRYDDPADRGVVLKHPDLVSYLRVMFDNDELNKTILQLGTQRRARQVYDNSVYTVD